MSTDVMEATEHVVMTPHNDYGVLPNLQSKPITWLCHLALMSREQPLAVIYPIHLQGKVLRVCVERSIQRVTFSPFGRGEVSEHALEMVGVWWFAGRAFARYIRGTR